MDFCLPGADGDPAGGQLAGCQHHAEDGSTLLLCTLAPLQWQVIPLYSYFIMYSNSIIWTSYILLLLLPLLFPVCTDSNTLLRESFVHWQESRCPNKTGKTGKMIYFCSIGNIWFFFFNFFALSAFLNRKLASTPRVFIFLVWGVGDLSWIVSFWFSPKHFFNKTFIISVSVGRRQNGENKPLTVPKDIDLHLEKTPVNVMDALGKTNFSSFISQPFSESIMSWD